MQWAPGVLGMLVLVTAVVLAPASSRSAAAQVYPPFVLVAGLVLVGLVADEDGLFAWTGRLLARSTPGAWTLFAGAGLVVALVTAVLNLDTAVVFVAPVVVYAARSRAMSETPFVVACLLLANAGSLLLPGSNLTNLIVLGHLHLSGGQFLHRMAVPWVVSVVVTTVVVGTVERRRLHEARPAPAGAGVPGAPGAPGSTVTPEHGPVVVGVGLVAVCATTVLVVTLRSPAVPVLVVGTGAAVIRSRRGDVGIDRARQVLGLPVLVGLFGLAVGLGTLGRQWAAPATLLGHLDAPATAVFGAVAAVLVNNLPAAAVLSARTPPHPFALLVGLDIGPNLFVTGSLAWVLWWRTLHRTGSEAPVRRAVVLGLLSGPMAMAAALLALAR